MAAPSCCTYGLCTKKAKAGHTRCAEHLGACECGERIPGDGKGPWVTPVKEHYVLGCRTPTKEKP